MDETTFRKQIGERIAYYRKLRGLTQLELAEKLNYSDKSVSKWERGEGLPDLYVFYTMAELFGIRVDDLIYDEPAKIETILPSKTKLLKNNRKVLIPLLAMGLVWLVTSVLFCIFSMLPTPIYDQRLFFVFAIPVSCVVLLVFSCIWWNHLCQALCVSALTWSLCLSAYLTVPVEEVRFFFIIAAVFQILTILWFVMKYLGKRFKNQK